MICRWDFKAKFIQTVAFRKYFGRKQPNIFKAPAQAKDTLREDGVRVITEVPYATKYPNSFCDIYLPKDEFWEKRGEKGVPVFVYFHGGGFLFGTKDTGDPIAKVSSGLGWLFNHFLERGIAVVSGGYAFAPKYRFPIQIEQTNELLGFLKKEGNRYHIDTEQILLGGGSAGADMTEIYGLFLADADYAARFDFAPSIPGNCLKGLIIDEAALDFPHFNDKAMDTMLGCWVGENNLKTGYFSNLVNVPLHIQNSYYPTFVTGSNSYFKDSAEQLKAKLDEIHVPCTIYCPPKELGVFNHGFMTEAGTQASDEAMTLLVAFVEEVLKG